jgi:tRNA (adenine37-N6)-methyltransferase
MTLINFKAIGIIKTPFTKLEGMPIQPTAGIGIGGTVELKKEYIEGLKDLVGFTHIILIYHLHKVTEAKLTVIPFMDEKPHGIFSCRAPLRPNPIGISVVRLLKIEKNKLLIEDVDILNRTPLLDIKPFIPQIDNRMNKNIGWLQGKENIFQRKSDTRFITNKFYKNEKDSNTNKSRTS